MGNQSGTYPRRRPGADGPGCTLRCRFASALYLLFVGIVLPIVPVLVATPVVAQVPAVGATSVPLILPTGLAYDGQGNLYFAETGRNLIRRVTPGGALTTYAGTGVQGFSGDGGLAGAADFDSPQAIALDAAGNLFIADTHNHRIRRVDVSSGIVSTVAGGGRPAGTSAGQIDLPSALAIDAAGNVFFADAGTHQVVRLDAISGVLSIIVGGRAQGYSGDGGAAVSASIDSPYGLAIDSQGNLFLSDTHNHCVRRVDHATGIISTISGTGQPGFAGDGGAASSASMQLPRGLVLDAAGDMFLVDSANHRLRRIDAATGQITTIAGDGTQAYAGDNGPAVAASLDSPRAVALSPAGLPTLSDLHNQRVRQVDQGQTIHTVAGLGGGGAVTLDLAVPSSVGYGGGQAMANLMGSTATGTVKFFDTAPGSTVPQVLASVPLVGNAAVLPLGTLAAGPHQLYALYAGDPSHAPAQSQTAATMIVAAAATATPNGIAMIYGTPVPPLTGLVLGILPQDAQAVSLVLSSSASANAVPGAYAIKAVLAGSGAGNYVLATSPAAVSVTKASVATSLSPALAVHVTSSTSGIPSGQVALIDGATVAQTASLNASGDAAFLASTLSTGSHTLAAAYSGNQDFLSATSAPLLLSTGPGTGPDFTLASSGQTAATVSGGSAATFSFAVAPVRGALNSPIQLSASGLPPGASASFSPAYLPPNANSSAFTLTIQTVHGGSVGGGASATNLRASAPLVVALGLPLLLLGVGGRRSLRRGLALVLVLCAGALMLNGCGSRTNSAPASASIQVYTLTVTATATADSGATLQHAASVTLSVQ